MSLTSARLKRNARLQAAAGDGKKAMGKGEPDKDAVTLLQTCLAEFGFRFKRSITPSGLFDGVFGSETDEAVKAFQRQNGLKADGLAGPKTLGRMDQLYTAQLHADNRKLNAELRSPHSTWHIT